MVAGAAASGARELADGAVRRYQLAEVARGARAGGGAGAPRIAGSLDEVGAALVAAPVTTASGALDPVAGARGWIERVARAARRRGAPVVIDAAGDPRAGDLVAALVRADGDRPGDRDRRRRPPARPASRARTSRCTSRRCSTTTGSPRSPPRCSGPLRRGRGRARCGSPAAATPLLVIELVRSIGGEPQPFAVDWSARTTAGIAELRARQLRAAPAGARRVAAAIAAWGGTVRIDRALATLRADGKGPATLADAADLERAGLAHRRGDAIAIDRATADAAEAIAGGDAIARLAAAGLATRAELAHPAAGAAGPGEPAEVDLQPLAPLLERAVLDAGRAGLACEVAEHLLARGRADRALGLAGRAYAIAPARAGLIAARAASATGAYRDAAALRAGAPRPRAPIRWPRG